MPRKMKDFSTEPVFGETLPVLNIEVRAKCVEAAWFVPAADELHHDSEEYGDFVWFRFSVPCHIAVFYHF